MGAFIKKPFSLFIFFILLLIPPRACSTQEQQRAQVQEEDLSNLGFISDATERPAQEEYEFIVVGGGTAGCPLAATLSQNHRVLVVERGGHILEHPSLLTQDGFLPTLTQVDSLDSPAEPFTSEDGVQNARGRVLGGSSAINAGFYSRADPGFFRRPPLRWDPHLVNQSYQWVEEALVFRPDLKKWQSAVRDALLDSHVLPFNGFSLDHLPGTKIGGSTFDSLGRRRTAADLLLGAHPGNLVVALRASAQRVLLDPGRRLRAAGVLYQDRSGGYHRALASSEVILCAGALGSPQLLLLSGIGPRPHLSSMGIPVARHLPHVGRFLYDNPRNGISILPPVPLDHSLIQVVGITDSGAYIEAASNIVPFSPPPRNAFLHNPAAPLFFTVATIMEKVARPLSVGSLRLASADVRVSPVVRFNYFAEAEDLARCVGGMRKIGELLGGRALDDLKIRRWFGGRDFRYVGAPLPFNQSDDGAMEEFCRRTVTTIWHYHGGCVAGKVVDGKHRVIGVESLRVVDGSTFPISPGTNPQATVMMLGRYVGVKLLEEQERRSREERY